ncbi:MAG: P1 family peptidase [Alphaproteobacteria bacterium]|nr:P1 family peptidase [Alphaproteobacteria bacterium]
MKRARLRELGIATGLLPTGPLNAITDVQGVRVGHATVNHDTPSVARTGVTAIWPAGPDIWSNAVFAGFHSFNGNGEMTGTIWIAEQGLIAGPVCITNTHSVGVVRDAIVAYAIRERTQQPWHLPVTAETYDGWLSDADSFPVKAEHAFAALDSAAGGPVAEGCVGGGTGMICHEFKGGIGTASRRVDTAGRTYTVGALVQANYGQRELLRVDGVPVGRAIGKDVVPSHRDLPNPAGGSIIVILATDAPLLPIQCQRLARRATVGLAWVGGIGANSSGDIFLAFSTANRVALGKPVADVGMIAPDQITPLFQAAAEATEEAILNAMTAAETTTGRLGRIVHALPLDLLQDAMRRHSPSSRTAR